MEQNNIYKTVFKVTHSGGSGSCFYLKAYDLFVTNYHVTEGFRTVAIHDNERNPYLAKVVLANPAMDIALLAAEGDFSSLPDISLAEDDTLTIGRKVYVAGYPYGMPFTITEGSVSSPKQLMDGKYYIQTDAAVNPGNSGGALVNEYGQVIGINSSKIASTEYEGMGFAVPSSTAVDTANSLIKNGYVAGRAKIGVTYNTITSYNNADAILSALTEKGFKNAKGTMVINQVSSDSDLAGKQVKKYDMIVAVNGKTMTSTDVMTQVLSDSKPGDTIKLTIARIENNQIKTFKVDCKLIENKGN